MTEAPDYSEFTVVIPTLNEASVISMLLTALKNLYPAIKIIVADDASTDGTQRCVKEFAAVYPEDVQLLERDKAGVVHGLTTSVLDAVMMVTTKFFVVMDGDLQHPPQVLAQMAQKILSGVDIVAGARIPYKENQGLHRVVMTKISTKIAKMVLRSKGIVISDPMSGFFCGRTTLVQQTIKEHLNSFEPCGYKVFFELLKILPRPLKIEEVWYQFAFRTGGRSKLKPRHALYFIRSLFK